MFIFLSFGEEKKERLNAKAILFSENALNQVFLGFYEEYKQQTKYTKLHHW